MQRLFQRVKAVFKSDEPSGDGLVVMVGYSDMGKRFEDPAMQARIRKFMGTTLSTLQASIDPKTQTALGFNGESALLNSRFHIAIGVPFAPLAGKSLGQSLEDCLALITNAYRESQGEDSSGAFHIAIGIAAGEICVSSQSTHTSSTQMEVTGQPFRGATDLMYWAEDLELGETGHQIAIDSGTYEMLDAHNRAKYRKWTSARSERLEDMKGDVYVRVLVGVRGMLF